MYDSVSLLYIVFNLNAAGTGILLRILTRYILAFCRNRKVSFGLVFRKEGEFSNSVHKSDDLASLTTDEYINYITSMPA